MPRDFPEIMAELRKARGLSQRAAAAELHISQALLSHYENGAREPGLPFIRRACLYYGVTADYLLGLSDEPHPSPDGGQRANRELRELAARLRALADRAEQAAMQTGGRQIQAEQEQAL